MKEIFQFLLGLQLLSLVLSAHLPNKVPTCYRNDEHLEKCLLSTSEIIKSRLQEGFPEYHAPSLDPLVVPTLDVIQKTNEFGFKVHLENFTVTGLSNYKFEKLRYDPETLTFFGTVVISPIFVSSAFDVKGNVVIVPLDTEGRFVAALGPIVAEFIIKGKLKTRNEEIYYTPANVQIKMAIEDYEIQSFDEHQVRPNLAHRSIIKLLNENSKTILPKLTPAIQDFFRKLTKKYVSLFTNAVPYDTFLPIR